MKELDKLNQDNTRDERQVHQEKKLGSRHIPRGMKVWQVDPKDEKPKEVDVKAARIVKKSISKDFSVKETHLKVERNPELFYCMAINTKNALRKYYKSPFYAKIRNSRQTQ